MMKSPKAAVIPTMLLLVAVLAAACGQPATQSEGESADGAAPAGTDAATDGEGRLAEEGATQESPAEDPQASGCDQAAYESVIAEVDGLGQDERWDRLVELAEAE